MIYLKQSYDLEPASPRTRDAFVEAVQDGLLPAGEALGARLVGAWFCHEEWFSRVVHVTELDDASAYGAWRDAVASEPAARDAAARLAELAPVQRADLLEPLGPVDTGVLHEAIAACRDEPVGTYTFAILDVAPGRMDDFAGLLGAAAGGLPIIGCWRGVTGSPDRVVDLWKGDIGRHGYRPNDAGQDAFFGPLREVAPREKMMRLHPMPYSPLQ